MSVHAIRTEGLTDMAVHAPSETLNALGGQTVRLCESRSLYMSRFADPAAKDDKFGTPRKEWFKGLLGKKAVKGPSHGWLASTSSVLYGRLMSRMMVDMAGGVMENAGLRLNRFGLPVVPGSAVKGCARRMALQALHDWTANRGKPMPADDLCAVICAPFKTPGHFLAAIAEVFGWVRQDWSAHSNQSDFKWACGDQFQVVWHDACEVLAQIYHWNLDRVNPWESLPDFGGTIAFIEGQPNTDPGLELDVLTPHHKLYYEGKKPVATDSEDPTPVFFPAIRAQRDTDYFAFPLLPLRNARPELLAHAKSWLALGLSLLGIGAKTNAGYGWFDTSAELSAQIEDKVREAANRALAEKEQKETAKVQKAIDDANKKKKADLESELEGLSPEQQEDLKLGKLTDAQFDGKIRLYCRPKGGPTDPEKGAIVRALRSNKLAYWQEFKTRAQEKGGELATIEQAIRAHCRQINLGKMP